MSIVNDLVAELVFRGHRAAGVGSGRTIRLTGRRQGTIAI